MKIAFREIVFFIYIFIVNTFHVSFTLYADQVGKFDWRQQYVGQLKYVHIDPVGTQKIIVATEENLLAALSVRTGAIVWRQLLERGEESIISSLSSSGEVLTASGDSTFLRSWDTNSGVLNWETALQTGNSDEDQLLKVHVNPETKEVAVIRSALGSYVSVTVYGILDASAKNSPKIAAPWLNSKSSCAFVGGKYFVCADAASRSLQLLPIAGGVKFAPVPLAMLGLQSNQGMVDFSVHSLPYQETASQPLFAVKLGKDGFMLVRVTPNGVKVVKVFPQVFHMTASILDDKYSIFAVLPRDGEYRMLVIDPDTGKELPELEGSFSLPPHHGQIEKVFVLPFAKKDKSSSYKIALSMQDHAILLLHHQGKILWTREESLASIIATEIIDLPLSETDAKIEEEFGSQDANIINMLVTRLTMQLLQLQTFLLQTIAGLQGHTEHAAGDDTTPDLTRDKFGLHKVIVAATKPGKIFGIDNLSGQIVWRQLVPNIIPFKKHNLPHFHLMVQRTTAHFPHSPVCTLIGRTQDSDNGRLYSFNPITGAYVASHTLAAPILHATMLGMIDDQYLRGILLVHPDSKVQCFPSESKKVLLKMKSSHYFFLANMSTGVLTGNTFHFSSDEEVKITEAWRLNLPNDIQQITQIIMKRPTEHVHSQGRVMGDRSVLYRYLNPNLAVVVTEGNDPIQKCYLNIYLVDAVTGSVVYSSSHKRAKGPIHVVHSENSIVYSYYNDKSRRMEMSSIELYEGKSQSNTTAFSSLSPPPLPLVEHQTYIFAGGIEAMTDTVTDKGITSKHLLIVLPTGGVVELPKAFLDPRRPVNPLPEHREEGLIPYMPELPISAEGIVNYNQNVYHARGIQTAPSGLESTCLVFVYGLDLFYTRVTPSKTFDILKDDFDHLLISAVLLGLLLFSYITRKLAARKALHAAWK